MLESKSITVSPKEEKSTIDFFANFGWSLKSSQEINSKGSHFERREDGVYSVATTENYVKIVLERDTKMDNYNIIKELENKYFNVMSHEPQKKQIRISPILTVILLICYIAPGVIYLAYKSRQKKKAEKTYKNDLAKWKKEEKIIAIVAIEESRKLV